MSAPPDWLRRAPRTPPAWLQRPAEAAQVARAFALPVDTSMRPLFAKLFAGPPAAERPSAPPCEPHDAEAGIEKRAIEQRGIEQHGIGAAGAGEIARAVAALEGAQRSLTEQARADAVELAFVLLKSLVGVAESVSPDKLIEVARAALLAAGPAKQVLVRVHPDDVAVMQSGAPSLFDSSAVQLRGDPTLARGDIVVETDAGRIDGTRSARLDQLERSVRTSIGCAR